MEKVVTNKSRGEGSETRMPRSQTFSLRFLLREISVAQATLSLLVCYGSPSKLYNAQLKLVRVKHGAPKAVSSNQKELY